MGEVRGSGEQRKIGTRLCDAETSLDALGKTKVESLGIFAS